MSRSPVAGEQGLHTPERVACDCSPVLCQNGQQPGSDIAYDPDLFQCKVYIVLSLAVPHLLCLFLIVRVLLTYVLRLFRRFSQAGDECSGGGAAIIHAATSQCHRLGDVTPDADPYARPAAGMTS